MNSATRAFPAGPTPAWSLAGAAADLDKVLTGLPTALLEALMRLERTPTHLRPPERGVLAGLPPLRR